VKSRVLLRIKLSNKGVFFRSDFKDIARYAQIGRALKGLTHSGDVVKIGSGIYTRGRPNVITGEPTIAMRGGFKKAVLITLNRLGVRYTASKSIEQYNTRQSNQIPANLILYVQPGFNRNISFNKLKAKFVASK
jgi:hypothetical protein